MELKQKAAQLEPVLRLGKNGLSENVFTEVKKLLKKRELVKIKALKSFSEDLDRTIEAILKNTGSRLITKRGNTFVIYKKLR